MAEYRILPFVRLYVKQKLPGATGWSRPLGLRSEAKRKLFLAPAAAAQRKRSGHILKDQAEGVARQISQRL
jgi:hypothetical protein